MGQWGFRRHSLRVPHGEPRAPRQGQKPQYARSPLYGVPVRRRTIANARRLRAFAPRRNPLRNALEGCGELHPKTDRRMFRNFVSVRSMAEGFGIKDGVSGTPAQDGYRFPLGRNPLSWKDALFRKRRNETDGAFLQQADASEASSQRRMHHPDTVRTETPVICRMQGPSS